MYLVDVQVHLQLVKHLRRHVLNDFGEVCVCVCIYQRISSLSRTKLNVQSNWYSPRDFIILDYSYHCRYCYRSQLRNLHHVMRYNTGNEINKKLTETLRFRP